MTNEKVQVGQSSSYVPTTKGVCENVRRPKSLRGATRWAYPLIRKGWGAGEAVILLNLSCQRDSRSWDITVNQAAQTVCVDGTSFESLSVCAAQAGGDATQAPSHHREGSSQLLHTCSSVTSSVKITMYGPLIYFQKATPIFCITFKAVRVWAEGLVRVMQRTVEPSFQELTDRATRRAPRSQGEAKAKRVQQPRQQRHGKGIIAHPSPQCQINQVKLKFQPSHRVWKKDRTIIIGKFCTAPLPINDNKKTVCLPEPVNLQASETVSHDLKITCI
eukprot:bmy_11746T0